MANSNSGESVIERVVRVLECFDSEHTVQSASALARMSGLPMSTAHRLIGDLADAGLLERDDEGLVRVGMRLWELSMRGSRMLGLRQVAMPFMQRLQQAVQQHTQLAVLENDSALYIERLSHPHASPNIAKIGGRLPLHASSAGQVLLAFAEPSVQDRILAGPLKALSRETPIDPDKLRRRLSTIRELGHTIATGSVAWESVGVAVPVRSPLGGRPATALSMVLPRDFPQVDDVIVRLKDAASGITDAMRTTPLVSR